MGVGISDLDFQKRNGGASKRNDPLKKCVFGREIGGFPPNFMKFSG